MSAQRLDLRDSQSELASYDPLPPEPLPADPLLPEPVALPPVPVPDPVPLEVEPPPGLDFEPVVPPLLLVPSPAPVELFLSYEQPGNAKPRNPDTMIAVKNEISFLMISSSRSGSHRYACSFLRATCMPQIDAYRSSLGNCPSDMSKVDYASRVLKKALAGCSKRSTCEARENRRAEAYL